MHRLWILTLPWSAKLEFAVGRARIFALSATSHASKKQLLFLHCLLCELTEALGNGYFTPFIGAVGAPVSSP